MLELHMTGARLMLVHCHSDGHVPFGPQLLLRMTAGATGLRWFLVVADLTTTGRLKSQVAAPGARAVAGDTGKSAVALVGERIGGERGSCAHLPRWISRWGVTLAPGSS